jgi:penicillin G amidase
VLNKLRLSLSTSLYPLCLLMICAWAAACDDDDTQQPAADTSATAPDTSTDPDAATGVDAADADDADTSTPPTPEQALILSIPETEAWTIPGLSAEVHVVRTEAGRPHLYAKNRADLGRALGFVVARDRYFMMDLQRRLALGTISNLLGDIALPNDIESRITGMTLTTDRILAGLTPEDAAYFDAYAEGVNTYIEHVRSGLLPPPSELSVATRLLFGPGTKPIDLMKPFDRRSLAAMAAVIVYQTNFEASDVGRTRDRDALQSLFEGAPFQALRRAGAIADAWDFQAPSFPVATTTGFGVEVGSSGKKKDLSTRPDTTKPLPPAARAPLPPSMLNRASDRLKNITDRLGRREVENFGSNTWAVAASHTANGDALVSGDGHLSLFVPSIMYQAGLNTRLFGDPATSDDIHQTGLLITSLPLLAVGTNGRVAWSQVNPVADITDWYAEQLTLGADGMPASSLFQGQQRPITRTDELYDVAAVPTLNSLARTETWPRFSTFDGRMIFDIEGREVTVDEPLNAGEARVRLADRFVVPADLDSDGVISAISLDYTAFDITGYIATLTSFTRADNVHEFQEATKGLVGNMLYTCAADMDGNILFSSYQGVPCRQYLARDAEGQWLPGADPSMLLDGTTYGGFTIPTLADGKVDESQSADPYRCAVPFDQTPQSINPDQGYLVNANNQPAPIHTDGTLYDDPWYIGGPWYATRADSIDQALRAATTQKTASVEVMSQTQANTRSRYGEWLTPPLLDALAEAKALSLSSPPGITPDQQRLLDLYTPNAAAFDEVATRLTAWQQAGYPTPSGVATFYHQPATGDAPNAVATMIFNAWMPRAIQKTFDDENMGASFRFSGSRGRLNLFHWMLDSRGPQNPRNLTSWYDQTQESIFFDIQQTPEVERSQEILLSSLADALTFLSGPPSGPASGGFGSDDMDTWIWGLRHQVRFESVLKDFLGDDPTFSGLIDQFAITTDRLPLADSFPPNDPRADLKWFPRPGDNDSVDASSPGYSGTQFTYGSGPAMRMVISLKDDRVSGVNIIPGGQSAITSSPHFTDQAALWLGNQTIPLRHHNDEVAAGATGRERLSP